MHNMPRKLMKPISIPSCQLWPEQAVEQSTPAYHVHTANLCRSETACAMLHKPDVKHLLLLRR